MNVNIPGTSFDLTLQPSMIQALTHWAIAGASPPCPDFIKKMTIVQYAKVFLATTFIETGTYLGSTTRLLADCGLECKTVELSEELYSDAVRNFATYKNVELFHGDSGALLGTMIEAGKPPYLFWLDGHYSGGATARGSSDTPVARELDQLLAYDMQDSVILIDDMRDFGTGDYPTVDYLHNFVAMNLPNHKAENFGDIFRITPKQILAERLGIITAV